jgi:hypothetical protein
MADRRGGYQKPRDPAAVSGPGKFSRRTDGQAKAVPNVGDSPDLQYGDRSMLEDAQRAAPARGSQGASIPRQMSGMPGSGKLPPWFTQSGDTNPSEPTTAGLLSGPGGGPEMLDASQPTDDVRETVLQFLDSTYGNVDARKMLAQLRAERAASAQPQMPSAPILGGGLPEPQPTDQPQQQEALNSPA